MRSRQELRESLERRLAELAPLRQATTALRLLDESSADSPGVTVELFGDYAVLGLYAAHARESCATIAEVLCELGVRGVYLKVHIKGDLRRVAADELAPVTPLAGVVAPESFAVREESQQSLIWLGDGLSTGLFVDQRNSRALIRAEARGTRFLNLFSYTCSFTVAAALGGASETLSIDLSARALARGKQNLELNAVQQGTHRFLKEDVLVWLARAQRRQDSYDFIVLDPPSFASMGSATFSVERDYQRIAAIALGLLTPGGRLLAVTNHRKTSEYAFDELLHGAAAHARRKLSESRVIPLPADCRPASGPPATKARLLTAASSEARDVSPFRR